MSTALDFDVVIVGGAMSGSVLALALSSQTEQKIRIALIEKSQPNPAEQGGFDARSIALAYGSLQKFAQIRPLAGGNLAERIARLATPIEQIAVSDQGHFGKTRLSAAELGLSKLGEVVELAALGQQLAALLADQPNIRLFCPDSISMITRSQHICRVQLASGNELSSPLLIAADGIHSQLARLCGVETDTLRDYQQSAVIANVAISEPHRNQAFERFTAQGPLALLPLRDKQMSLVWCVEQPQNLLALSDADFLTQLQQAFGWQLGKFLQLSKRSVYPLSLQKAASHIHHRLAIVGNAAQLLHPVAGQGFNLGMRDLFSLSLLLSDAFNQGQDLGSFSLLQQFATQRAADQQRIMQRTNGLISLFCAENLPLQIARNVGLTALSHCRGARGWVAHQALGW